MKRTEALFFLVALLASLALFVPLERPEATVKADVAVMFTPEDRATEAIASVIDEARAEVLVGMFTFTNRDLARALIRAHERGVVVKVLIDEGQADMRYSKAGDLREAGVAIVEVELGQTGDNQDIRYHNKFAVIDRKLVVTGSFNWTQQADLENYENLLLLRSEKLAETFQEKFDEHWEAFTR